MARNSFERDIDGWKNAPVPLCMGGDLRALVWCCKPGPVLACQLQCTRDSTFKEVGLSPKEFIKIKDEFSKKNGWDDENGITCFGSLAYCCMRNSGCGRRDLFLSRVYKNVDLQEAKKLYFEKKKELSKIILEACKNKKLVNPLLKDFD